MRVKCIFYYLCFFFMFVVGIISIVVFSYNVYLQLLGSSGGFIASTAIFILIIINLPSFQKTVAPLLRSLNFIQKADEASIAYNIQGNINEFREVVNKESPGLIPEAEVEFVTQTNKESFFDKRKGKVIIRLRSSKENPKNLAKAVMIHVSKGVIPESRMYVGEKTSRSIDLTLAKKILVAQKQHDALRYYVNEILNPELSDKTMLHLVETLDAIDEKGFLTRLYLRELGQLPKKQGLRLKGLSKIRDETYELLGFLEAIATRERGEEVPLSYEGRFVKTAVIMVSEERKFERKGIGPYVLAAVMEAKKGSDIIYILASGHKITNALSVIQYLRDKLGMAPIEDTLEPYEVSLDDEGKKVICAAVEVS